MTIDIKEILNLIPHKYPFVLVDKVIEIHHNQSIIAVKNVTYNEYFFAGHFPHEPIMPGVLIIESLAQAACILAIKSIQHNTNSAGQTQLPLSVYFMSVESAKFRKKVIPGDTLYLSATVTQQRSKVWKFTCSATVDGREVCGVNLTAMCIPTTIYINTH